MPASALPLTARAFTTSSLPAALASSVASAPLTSPLPSRTRLPLTAVMLALAVESPAVTVKSCTLPEAPAICRLEPPMSSMARRVPSSLKAAACVTSSPGLALPALIARRAARPTASMLLACDWLMLDAAPPVVVMPIRAAPVWAPPAVPSAVAAARILPLIASAPLLDRSTSAAPKVAPAAIVVPAAWVSVPPWACTSMPACWLARAFTLAFSAMAPAAEASSIWASAPLASSWPSRFTPALPDTASLAAPLAAPACTLPFAATFARPPAASETPALPPTPLAVEARTVVASIRPLAVTSSTDARTLLTSTRPRTALAPACSTACAPALSPVLALATVSTAAEVSSVPEAETFRLAPAPRLLLPATVPAPFSTRSPFTAAMLALAVESAAPTLKSCTRPEAPAMSRLEPPMASMTRRVPSSSKAALRLVLSNGLLLPALTSRRAERPTAAMVLPADCTTVALAPPLVVRPTRAAPVWAPSTVPSSVAAALTWPLIVIAPLLDRSTWATPALAPLRRVPAWVRLPSCARTPMAPRSPPCVARLPSRTTLPLAASKSMPALLPTAFRLPAMPMLPSASMSMLALAPVTLTTPPAATLAEPAASSTTRASPLVPEA